MPKVSKEQYVEEKDEKIKAVKHIDDGSDRTISYKESLRKKIESDIEKFIAQGGTVEKIDPSVTADPPRKPVSNYGSRPI